MKLTDFLTKFPTWEAPGEPAGGPAPEPAVADESEGGAPPAASSDAAPDFSWVPDGYKGENGDVDFDRFGTEVQELLADKARRDETAALVPEDGEYEFALPDEIDYGELDLPAGYNVSIDTEDEAFQPLFGELGGLLKDLNAPADTAGKVMSLLAKYEAARSSKAFGATKADFEKLGGNDAMRQARLKSIETKLKGRVPDEKHVNALMDLTYSYDGVRALETLLAPGGPGPAVPRIPAENSRDADLEAYYSQPTRSR